VPVKPGYHPKLYLSAGISGKKLDKIKRNLSRHPLRAGVYLITAAKGGNLLEIYCSGLLSQRYYRNNPPYIIGISENYEEAVRLVEQIVDECLKARGDCAIREFLSC
jgi:hypothetical protein